MRTAQRCRIPAALACIVMAAASPRIAASDVVNTTPTDITCYWWEPYVGHLGIELTNLARVAGQQGYLVEVRLSDWTSVPYMTVDQYVEDTDAGGGMHVQSTHASTSGWSIQTYPPTAQGLAERKADYDEYVNSGRYQDQVDIYPSMAVDDFGNTVGYAIAVTKGRMLFHSFNSVVFDASCYSDTKLDSWGGATVLAGHDKVTNVQWKAAADTVGCRWNGERGISKRSTAEAVSGTILVASGDLYKTLAPAVTKVCIPPGMPINTADRKILLAVTGCTITFDSRMAETEPSDYLNTDGVNVMLVRPRWTSDTELYCELIPNGKDTYDNLRLTAYDVNNYVYDGAKSDGGMSMDPDGVGPNRHDLVVPLYSVIDNPAPSIAWFRPIRQLDGVHVEWKVESQDSTVCYLVQRSDDRFGPFSTIAAVPVDTARTEYAVVDWGRTDGFYRLLDIEADGDTLFQGFDGVNDPVDVPPDDVASAAVADSITSTMLARYPHQLESVNQILPIWGITYITKSGWESALDARVSKLVSLGNVVNVMSIESFGSTKAAQRSGINAYIDQCIPYGLWAVCLAGDNEDTEAWDAFLWYDWTKPTWPSEALADIVPSFYLPDVSHVQSKSQSWYTSYLNTDQLYGAGPDSLPRITITRIPARSAAELTYACAKADAYEALVEQHQGAYAFFVQDLDLNGNSGQVAMDQARAAMAKVPSPYSVQLYADSLGSSYTYAQRQAMFLGALGQTDPSNRVLAAEFSGTMSNRNQLANWFQYSLGGRWSLLSAGTGICAVLAPVCEFAGTSRRIDPSAARGFMETAVTLYPDRGPALIIGANCGTDQVVNGMLSEVFHDVVTTSGARSGPEAWTMTLQIVGRMFPGNERVLHAVLSTGVIGFPESKWPGMVVRTTGVGDGAGVSRVYFTPPFPNPSRGNQTFGFALPSAGPVTLAIYDVSGRLVTTLVDGMFTSGGHSAMWNRTDRNSQPVNAGIYFARLTTCGQTITQKVIALR